MLLAAKLISGDAVAYGEEHLASKVMWQTFPLHSVHLMFPFLFEYLYMKKAP